jgi:membrane protein DedA with SNARE-associated domain
MDAIIQTAMKDLTQVSPWIIYLVLFVSAVLQMVLPPYPGDTVLLVGGCLGSLGLEGGGAPIFVSYVLGTIISSYGLYLVALKNGEAVLNYKFVSKYFPKSTQGKVKKLIWKYGIFIFFLCKFIPGLNSITIIFGGIFKYSPIATLMVVGISSLFHNFIFFVIGKSIGYNLDKINSFLSTYNTVAILLFIGIIAIVAAVKFRKLYIR